MNKDLFLENLISNISCPLSKLIFYDPVRADDGYTYERTCLEEWLKNNNNSPLTKQKINKYITDFDKKKLVDIILTEHQKYKKMRYSCTKSIIMQIVNNKNYSELCFDRFDIGEILKLNHESIKKFIVNIRANDIKKIIFDFDPIKINIKDINKDKNENEYLDSEPVEKDYRSNLMHYICQYGNPEIIKYCIDKKFMISYYDKKGKIIIYYLCKYSTPEVIKYYINRFKNCRIFDEKNRSILYYICKYSNLEITKYALEKLYYMYYDFNDNKGRLVINYICKYSDPNILKYVVDLERNIQASLAIRYYVTSIIRSIILFAVMMFKNLIKINYLIICIVIEKRYAKYWYIILIEFLNSIKKIVIIFLCLYSTMLLMKVNIVL